MILADTDVLIDSLRGGLDDTTRGKVEAIHSVDDLEQMGERVLSATTLQDVDPRLG